MIKRKKYKKNGDYNKEVRGRTEKKKKGQMKITEKGEERKTDYSNMTNMTNRNLPPISVFGLGNGSA